MLFIYPPPKGVPPFQLTRGEILNGRQRYLNFEGFNPERHPLWKGYNYSKFQTWSLVSTLRDSWFFPELVPRFDTWHCRW